MNKIILLFSLALLLSGCNRARQEQGREDDDVTIDLPQLKAQGEITAVTLYSSTSYFQYKMQPMGYEYELIKDFARSEGLKLNIKVAESPAKLIEMLEAGEADVVAYPIQISNRMKEKLIYCGREEQDCQMLIQRANKGDKVITDVTELLGKDVYVKPGTKYFERLKNLDVELGGGIRIHEADADTVTTEDLIGMVSQGEIPYTISDENIARLNKTYFWNLNVSLKISFMQRSSWVVRKSSPELAKAIDAWASDKAGTHVYKALTKRYFELSKQPVTTELPEVKNGHVSPYDELFRKHAKNIGWDWQLLASIGYQESRFNPERRLMGRRRRADGNHAEHGKGFRGNASRTEKSGHGNPYGCGLPAPFPSGIWKNNGSGRKDQVHLSGLQCRDWAYLRCPTTGREIRQRPIRLG